MRPVHDRMPVILQSDAWLRWLDPEVQHPHEVADLLAPCDDGFLTRREVGAYVNNARHEGEACLLLENITSTKDDTCPQVYSKNSFFRP